MDSFSYTDNVRAAFASCLPCFTASRSESTSNAPQNAVNAGLSDPRSTSTTTRPSSSSSDLEHLLRDTDSDGISLHSNLGNAAHRRARRRRRPKFSLTLFGYTLFGRPPIYLSDDEEEDVHGTDSRRARTLLTNSSSTLDSDAAPLDASTIERLTSPDHIAALAAQREAERKRLEVEEEAHRKAGRRARKQERKARARASALMSLTGATSQPEDDAFEGFQGSGNGVAPPSFPFRQTVGVVPGHPGLVGTGWDGDLDGSNDPHSDDPGDADLGGELYARKKKLSGTLSGSGSDSRSRTSASLSAGDVSHIQNPLTRTTQQSIPYPHTQMHLPTPVGTKPKSHRASKRTSTVSSVTSQSTSTAPYTPVESVSTTPAVAALPIPQERFIPDGEQSDFPSVGLSGKRRPGSLDPRAFITHQG